MHTTSIYIPTALLALALGCGKDSAPAGASKGGPGASKPGAPTTPGGGASPPPSVPGAKAVGPRGEMIVAADALPAGHDVDRIAVAGDHLYWVMAEPGVGSRLLRTPVTGGPAVEVARAKNFHDLVVTATHVVWREDREVKRMAWAGGAIETVHTGEPCGVIAAGADVIVLDDRELLRIDDDGVRERRTIDAVRVCNGRAVGAPGGVVWSGHATEAWAEAKDRELWQLTLDGGATRLAQAPVYFKSGVLHLQVVGETLYYGGGILGDGSGVFRRPLGGGDATRQFPNLPITDRVVASDGTVFAVAQGRDDGAVYHIYRLAPDGGQTVLARHDFDFMPEQLVVSGDHVYWHDRDRIQRARAR